MSDNAVLEQPNSPATPSQAAVVADAAAVVSKEATPSFQVGSDPASRVEADAPSAVQTATETQSTVPADIAALAEQVGFKPEQFAGFTDVASAEAAVALWLDGQSKRGTEFQVTPDQNVKVGGSVPPSNTEAGEAAFDLDALGLSETDAAAKALRKMEKEILASRQQIQQFVDHVKTVEQRAQEQERDAIFNNAQKIVSDWQSPVFGVPGKNQTLLQLAAQEKLYQLARQYEMADLKDGNPVAPLPVRLNRARFSLGDRPKKGPALKPVSTIIPTSRSNEQTVAGGSSFSGPWSADPAVRAKLRSL